MALGLTIGSFALILVLSRFRVPLWAAILAGTCALGASLGLPLEQIALAAGMGIIKPKTIDLVVLITMLLVLSDLMREGGQLEEIVLLVKAFLRRPAVALAALPALIGLLPMPGGAIFSAPMVESAAGKADISSGRLSAINYWFRHIWEHWWPLYPGVILAITLIPVAGAGVEQQQTGSRQIALWIAIQMPLGVFMVLSGLTVFWGIHPDLRRTQPPTPGIWPKLLRATSSIWIIMVVWAAAWAGVESLPKGFFHSEHPYLRSALVELPEFVPIILGLLVSLVWTVHRNGLTRRQVMTVLTRKGTYALTGLALSIMIYQSILERTGAARRISVELSSVHVPVLLVLVILPFVAGMVTGLALGFVGTSFPIVIKLIEGTPEMRAYLMLAYAAGHLGMMVSPLHLCYVVSNQYFKTPFGPVYRLILPSAGIMATLAVAYFLLLGTIGV
jgi:hypothetical protein